MSSAAGAVTAKPRSGLPFTLLGAILAVVGFGAVMLFASTSGGHGGTVATTKIVVAARDIDYRTQLTAADLSVVPWSSSSLPPGYFTATGDLVGLVATVDIRAGQPLLGNLVVKQGDIVNGPQTAFLPIPPGFVAFTIPTGEQQGVAGYIEPGDYISVVAIFTPKGAQFSNVRTVYGNVHVIKVGPAPADPSQPVPKTGNALSSSLTVVVTQCQAEYLNWFLTNGSVRYTLESHSDYTAQAAGVDKSCPNVDAARGVTLSDVQSRWPGLA